MDSFEINKFVACLLVVALVFIGLANFGEILYHVDKPEVAHYKIEGIDDDVSTMASELAVPAVAEPLERYQNALRHQQISVREKKFLKNVLSAMYLIKVVQIKLVQLYGISLIKK